MAHRSQPLAQRISQQHERLQTSSTAIAGLSGLSRTYYVGLRTGQRTRISIFKLRRLCECGLRLSEQDSLEIFRERLQLDLANRSPFPVEFFWRLARFDSWQRVARLVGVDRSYIVKIVHGQRIPSYAIMQALGELLGYSEQDAMRLLVACHKFQTQKIRQHRKSTHPPRLQIGAGH